LTKGQEEEEEEASKFEVVTIGPYVCLYDDSDSDDADREDYADSVTVSMILTIDGDDDVNHAILSMYTVYHQRRQCVHIQDELQVSQLPSHQH